MKILDHLKDKLLIYIPFFLLYGLAVATTHNDYIKMGIVFAGLTILLVGLIIFKDYLEKRNLRRKSESRWRFLTDLSSNEQDAIRKQHEIGKLRGLWSLPELDEEIKRHFLNSKKVKIKVTRGYNLFFDNGSNLERDIFYQCIFEQGKHTQREIELLLHFPCLKSEHTISRAQANKITPEYYIETLFEVIKIIKEVTKAVSNKNEITVKFYNDYEIKWRYYIFEERNSNKKTLFLNYYDDKMSGADSSMLKIEYGEGSLCQDFDKRFDDIFQNKNKAKEIVSNLKGDASLLTAKICGHPECEKKIREMYYKIFL